MIHDPNTDAARPGLRITPLRLRFVLAFAFLAIACWIDAARAASTTAPDFALRSFERGNQRLSEYRGDVVVLGFWASWCGDCRRSLPGLNELYARHRDGGLVMLGINLDRDAHRAREFARILQLDFPVLIDADGAVSRLYEVENVPRVIVIDRDGFVRHAYDDAGPDLERDIVALLGE